MRKTPAILASALLAAAAASTAAPALAQSPYPPSTVIGAIEWGAARSFGVGGDIWPVDTRPADGAVEGAWGDGKVVCPVKVSFGTAHLPTKPGVKLTVDGCGPQGSRGGKISDLLYNGSTLYALLNDQDRPWPDSDMRLMRSSDSGAHWYVIGHALGQHLKPTGWFHDAPQDGFTYVILEQHLAAAHKIFLGRVPTPQIGQLRSVLEYFTGTAAAPTWGAQAAAQPIIVSPKTVEYPAASYLKSQHRFLVSAGMGDPDSSMILDAPAPWGPYTTVEWVESGWRGLTAGGEHQRLSFPLAYQATDRATAVFGCYGTGCGGEHDRGTLIAAQFKVPVDIPPPVPVPTPGGGAARVPVPVPVPAPGPAASRRPAAVSTAVTSGAPATKPPKAASSPSAGGATGSGSVPKPSATP